MDAQNGKLLGTCVVYSHQVQSAGIFCQPISSESSTSSPPTTLLSRLHTLKRRLAGCHCACPELYTRLRSGQLGQACFSWRTSRTLGPAPFTCTRRQLTGAVAKDRPAPSGSLHTGHRHAHTTLWTTNKAGWARRGFTERDQLASPEDGNVNGSKGANLRPHQGLKSERPPFLSRGVG